MTDNEKLIAFMKRVTPITHEPLAQQVAEEWATKFVQEFPEFEKAHTPTDSHAYRGNRSQDTCWVEVNGEMCRKPIEAHAPTDGEREHVFEVSGAFRVCGTCGLADFQHKPQREPTDDEQEALGWREAEAYADDHEPSKRAETADDFMAGWRTASALESALRRTEVPEPQGERFADHSERYVPKRQKDPQGEPSDAAINAAALELYGVSATYDPARVASALRAAWEVNPSVGEKPL